MRIRKYKYIIFSLCLILFYSCQTEICKNNPIYKGFDTLKKRDGDIILIGDTQMTSNWEFWRENNKDKTTILIKEIAKLEPAGIINLGDLVFRASSCDLWAQFDLFHKPVLEKKIPYFPLPGNHEYYGPNEVAFGNYFARFPHLKNKKWYSFDYKGVGFILADSNFSELTENEKDKELKWYQKELIKMEEDKRIHFIIICTHYPPFTNSKVVDPSPEVKTHFVEPFLKTKKGALFFTGHCHSYEKFKYKGRYFIVSGGGGGPRQKLETDPEDIKYKDLFQGKKIRFFHFCQMNIQDNKLVIKVIKLNKNGVFSTADKIHWEKK